MHTIKILFVYCLLTLLPPAHAEEADNHPNETTPTSTHDAHSEEEIAVELSLEQIKMAGIKIIEVRPEPVAEIIRAPGEVVLNAYRTAHVTPRIEAQIIARKARLGDAVEQGQALVTLSSVGMAEAQGALLVANREWQRVRKLGRKVVSERRYIEAQVARQQAYAKVLAYGMTQAQIDRLLREGKASSANGTFDLLSPQDGTVISDDFIIGELAAAGRLLFTITDETTLWVDARLTPEEAGLIETGAAVAIRTGQLELPGKVIQIKHALDEKTRTWPVRIEVANPDDVLHPGLFVTAEIRSNRQETAIAVPVAAVLRSPDGDWQVFVEEEPGHYTPKEVTVVRPAGNRMVVTGLSTGERIVGEGAFFVQSEIAKSGFEVHDH